MMSAGAWEPEKDLIEKTEYHLRDAELDLLGARIAFYNNQLDEAQHQLKHARERLEAMGYWGLLPVWERVASTASFRILRIDFVRRLLFNI